MFHDYLILGGAGLVGLQVCRHIVEQLHPKRLVVASLLEREAREACDKLEAEFGDGIAFVPAWGNLFVPTKMAELHRNDIMGDRKLRQELLGWLYGDFDSAYRINHLVTLIRAHRPEVIVDCVNTATGLSYQNVFDGANKVLEWLSDDGSYDKRGVRDLETLLLSQSVPQLIRHVRFVHRATSEYATNIYVKVGTTGTGGMGLNIPYTHSEDKPSKVLLAKTEAAFGHTGLLFLLARTPNAPIVKEVKPAAMIGYRAVRTIKVSDKNGNNKLFAPKECKVGGTLELSDTGDYDKVGDLVVSVVDTGENGVFTRGEFAAITALGQMEYVTPEEIARMIVLEIRGANSGQDIISALDSAVINPSYKAGLVRAAAMSDLREFDEAADIPSVALGRLGPPELSKLLFEAQLLKETFGRLSMVYHDDKQVPRSAQFVSDAVNKQLAKSSVRIQGPSIGIPILMPNGTLLRGPRINVPEVAGSKQQVSLDDARQVDRWAAKGWIDLRPANMERWLSRLAKMIDARMELRDAGSAAASIRSYLPTRFEIGEVVAWIFNNEMGGHRIK